MWTKITTVRITDMGVRGTVEKTLPYGGSVCNQRIAAERSRVEQPRREAPISLFSESFNCFRPL